MDITSILDMVPTGRIPSLIFCAAAFVLFMMLCKRIK